MTSEVDAMLDRLYESDAGQRAAGLSQAQRTRNVDRETGHFLKMLAVTARCRRILEIGSSNGVSTIWFAAAAAEIEGTVIGTEILPARAEEANANLREAGLADVASVLSGAAQEQIAHLTGPFDLIFIDAEKDDYVNHLRAVLPLLRDGGLLLADNVISHDLSEFQSTLRSLPNMEAVTLPLGRGLEFAVKRGRATT